MESISMLDKLTTDPIRPEKEFVIEDLETLKVISDPRRMQILELVVLEPKTVKQIAKELGITPNKLYYHMNLLEKHELIRVVSTKLVSGIVEKHYQVSAEDITIADGLISVSGPEGEDTVGALMTTVFDSSKEEFLRMLKTRSSETESLESRTMLIAKEKARMTTAQAKQFGQGLAQLLEDFKASDTEDLEAQPYVLMATLYPTSRLGGENEDE
jgi:predicted ArsR family transcriptional regulator